MFLSQTASYALRITAYLASQPDGVAVSRHDLSEATGVPTAYLSKVCRRLVLAKLLDSRKGHRGGFSLAREVAAICVSDILDAVDHPVVNGTCIFTSEKCDVEPCSLHESWSEQVRSFAHWAKSTTLADVRAAALAGARDGED